MGEDYPETPQGGTSARPEPRAGRDLREQIALLSAQVSRLGERVSGAGAVPEARPPALAAAADRPAVDSISASILASAESVAAEIRSSALREAQALRQSAEGQTDVRLAGLAAMIEGHRETLAALVSDSGQIERSAAALSARVRALEGELQAIGEAIEAVRSRRSA